MWKSDQERSEFFARFESDEARRLASELEQKSFRPADPDKPHIFYSGRESTKSGGTWEVTPEGVADQSRPGLFSYESYSRLSDEAAKSEYGFTKIEDTEGGEWLKSNVWDVKVDIPKADKERLGDLASRFYARGAQGDVVAVVGDANNPRGAFYNEEWRELLQNEKVRTINGVPRESYQRVASDGRRDGYDRSFEMVRETAPHPDRQPLNRRSYDQAMREARLKERAANDPSSHSPDDGVKPGKAEVKKADREKSSDRLAQQSRALNEGKTAPSQPKGDQSQRLQSQSQELNRQTSTSVQLPARETASASQAPTQSKPTQSPGR